MWGHLPINVEDLKLFLQRLIKGACNANSHGTSAVSVSEWKRFSRGGQGPASSSFLQTREDAGADVFPLFSSINERH